MSKMTDSKTGFPQPGLDAAREGRVIRGYVNSKTGIDTEAVLTDTTFLNAIPGGRRLVITEFHMMLATVSDWVTVEFVTTANADGTGEVTPKTAKYRMATGAALVNSPPQIIQFCPPIAVTNGTAGAFSARVQGNDSAASLTLEYRGWQETDTPTN